MDTAKPLNHHIKKSVVIITGGLYVNGSILLPINEINGFLYCYMSAMYCPYALRKIVKLIEFTDQLLYCSLVCTFIYLVPRYSEIVAHDLDIPKALVPFLYLPSSNM